MLSKAYATQTTPSPEVMSKAASNEEATEVKILTEKLSAALLKISAKEDLVQQHAKVAEEAISGILYFGFPSISMDWCYLMMFIVTKI